MAFDASVADRGYRWWYLDALSDDGQHGLVVIAMLGNVFSPYYARARRRGGDTNPLEFVTMNVALYGPRARWSLTERRSSAVVRTATELALGPSSMRFDGSTLEVRIEERASPFPQRISGVVRIRTESLVDAPIDLDARGCHRWSPISTHAPIEVELTEPALRFRGHAYVDQNWGTEPLEDGFRSWTWARSVGPDASVIGYVAERRDGSTTERLRVVDARGRVHDEDPLRPVVQGQGLWGVERRGFADPGATLVHRQALEDTPFYLRDVSEGALLGASRVIVSETLDLDRFVAPWVQFLLPFRMARG
jgi:carotenoid 1,2-hydratase